MRVQRLIAVVIAVAFVSDARAQEPVTAADYLKRGDGHFASSAYDKAVADYTKAIELDGGLVQAFRMRATAYAKQGKHEKAVADYDKMIALDASAISYRIRASYYMYSTGKNLKAAIADFSSVIELEPRSKYHLTERAQAYAENKEYDLAFADLTEAIKIDPTFEYSYISRALACLHNNRPDDAIADCTSLLSICEKGDARDKKYKEYQCMCHLVRGEALRRKGSVERATADFNKVVELEPGNVGALYLHQQKLLPDILKIDAEAIIGDATKTILKTPKQAEAYVRRGAIYQVTGESVKAIEDYTTALKLVPEQAAALRVCRGAAYQSQGRYASAVADYREALQLEPKMALAEGLLNAGIAKLTEYKSKTTLESVRLDEEVFFVTTAVEKMTLPEGGKKTLKKTLTTKHEVTVADVRKLDVEVRNSLKLKQESTSGSSSSSTTNESTNGGGGASLNLGFLSFSGQGGKSWGSGSETGYSSNTLSGWESEFGTTIRTGMEKSRAWTSSVESSEGVEIELIGKGDDQPILVIYQDKYRSGTAKMKINGVTDEVRFTFPVGKDMTWKYAAKPKTDDKK